MIEQIEPEGLPRAMAGAAWVICACILAMAGCTRGDDAAQGAAAPVVTPAAGGLDGLRAQAQSLAGQLRALPASSAELDAQARSLVATALPVAGDIAREYPECVEHITLVLDGVALMDALSAAQLERTWYHDGSVPPAPVLCRHAQDLVVRPVRVVARLREGALTDSRDELLTDLDGLLEDIGAIERRR